MGCFVMCVFKTFKLVSIIDFTTVRGLKTLLAISLQTPMEVCVSFYSLSFLLLQFFKSFDIILFLLYFGIE
jgi:hypothetical protein